MTEQDVVLRQQELLKVMEELEREVRSFHADVQARTALWADVERFGRAFGVASQLLLCEHELTLIARQLDRLRGGSAGGSVGREADAASGRSSGDEEVEIASASAELRRMLRRLREVQPEWAGRIQEAWDSIVAHGSAQRAANWERRTTDVLARILAPLDRDRRSDAGRSLPEVPYPRIVSVSSEELSLKMVRAARYPDSSLVRVAAWTQGCMLTKGRFFMATGIRREDLPCAGDYDWSSLPSAWLPCGY